MSSSVIAEKSRQISSRDILAASQPRTSPTVIRISRMQGLPPRSPELDGDDGAVAHGK